MSASYEPPRLACLGRIRALLRRRKGVPVDVRTADGWHLVIKLRPSTRSERVFYDATVTDPQGCVLYVQISWPTLPLSLASACNHVGVGREMPEVAEALRKLALAEIGTAK